METLALQPRTREGALKDMTVEEAYKQLCSKLKAIYKINNAL